MSFKDLKLKHNAELLDQQTKFQTLQNDFDKQVTLHQQLSNEILQLKEQLNAKVFLITIQPTLSD